VSFYVFDNCNFTVSTSWEGGRVHLASLGLATWLPVPVQPRASSHQGHRPAEPPRGPALARGTEWRWGDPSP